MTADVFISYSRQDTARVLPLIERLRARGISAWIDSGNIEGATMWSEEIVEAIEGCKVLVLMVTQSSVSSHNVVKEVALSSERKKHILPVYLEPVEMPKALKYPLAGIQHIEHFADDAANFDALIRALVRLGVTLATTASSTGPKMHVSETHHEGPKLLAVLPFDNISPERDTDYFSDGLTEELIANLSKLSEIKVVSRTTTMQYKETKKDTRTIATELNVHYILEGSVRKIADNLRITAQLVEVDTDAHIWAETYKGTMADVFDIQEKVAKEIADALKLKLTPTEKAILTKRATNVPEAFDSVLKARGFLQSATKTNLGYAIDLFKRAIELDPRYAEAYAGLALSYMRLYQVFERDDALLDQAMEASIKALMYDKDSADAYAALALVQFAKGQHEEASLSVQRASELPSTNYLGYWLLGRAMMNLDLLAEARSFFLRSIELNPYDYVSLEILRMVYDRMAKKEEAQNVDVQILGMLPGYISKNPDDARARMLFACTLASQGHVDAARTASMKALEVSPNDALMLYYAACLYGRLGDAELSVNVLASAVRAGWNDHEWTKRDPDLDSIREHPGYMELMKDK